MNRTLFRSLHGVVSLVVLLVAAAFVTVGPGHAGRAASGGKTFLLVSGWVALALFAVAYAYVARKYAHKLGYSPEFRLKLPRAKLEQAEKRLDELRYQIAQRVIVEPADILRRARAVLREEGCERVLRVELARTGQDTSLLTLRTEPLGRMARWLHAHAYYGFAACVLGLIHGGASLASPMGWVLSGLTLIVLVTGLVGIVFWAFGPSWLTALERDLSIEEAFVLDRHYERRLKEAQGALGELDPALARLLWSAAAPSASEIEAARTKLASTLGNPVQAADLLALAGQRRRTRQELARLTRLRFWMNAWRLLHIPASIVLLGVITLHVVTVWLY